jgi:3-oxoacyl-[acyl-carrier-protein] synthase-3
VTNIGIKGIGIFLPEQVRENNWWPAELVEAWTQKRVAKMMRPGRQPQDAHTPGVRRVLAELEKLGPDPFLGGKARHVIADGMLTSEMALRAAQNALQDAQLQPEQIDILLEFTNVPDVLTCPNAYAIHRKLGLPERCLAMNVDATCNSFLMQLQIAESLIAQGVGRHALLVQCTCISRVAPPEEPFSPWFGDGASAVVVAPASDGFGVLGWSHRIDSSLYRAIGAGVPGGAWYDGGRIRLYSDDPDASRKVILGSWDRAKQSLEEALSRAGVGAEQIAFLGNHPAALWFADVVRDAAGLVNAKTVDTFTRTGNLGGANIPVSLFLGREQGLVERGDLVAAHGGGAGMTWTGMVMRWGCS